MLLLKPRLDAAKLAFETQIAGSGYTLSQIMEEYQEGQAKLNSGAEQIAAAEEQLAAAKAELDAGYAQAAEGQAQLDAAQAELEAAKAQLDAGKAQIDAGEQQLGGAGAQLREGYEQLQDAEEQLEEGRKTLEENRQQLQSDLTALDQYSSDEERLDAGMEILLQQPEISAISFAFFTAFSMKVLPSSMVSCSIPASRMERISSKSPPRMALISMSL